MNARWVESGRLDPGVFSAYRRIALRAYRIEVASGLTGRPVRDLSGIAHLRRAHPPRRARSMPPDSVLEPGDVVAISARERLAEGRAVVPEVDDQDLLDAGHRGGRLRARGGQRLTRKIADLPWTGHLPPQDRSWHGRSHPPGNRDPAGDILTIGEHGT